MEAGKMLMICLGMMDTQEEKSKFEELYYQYRKLMHWRAKQILNDDMLAEDAVHEAFIKIIRHMVLKIMKNLYK